MHAPVDFGRAVALSVRTCSVGFGRDLLATFDAGLDLRRSRCLVRFRLRGELLWGVATKLVAIKRLGRPGAIVSVAKRAFL